MVSFNSSGPDRPETPDEEFDHFQYTPTTSPSPPEQHRMADDEASEPETVASAADTEISNAETVDVDEESFEDVTKIPEFLAPGGIPSDGYQGSSAEQPSPVQEKNAAAGCSELNILFRERPMQDDPELGADSELTIQAPSDDPEAVSTPIVTSNPDIQESTKTTAHKPAQARSNQSTPSMTDILLSVIFCAFGLGLFAHQSGITMGFLGQSLNAGAELAIRREGLSQVMSRFDNESAIYTSVNIDKILGYQQAAKIVNGTPTSTVEFPRSVHVEIAKPDQLFISTPKLPGTNTYPSKIRVEVVKDGQTLDIKRTPLIDGVFHVSIDPSKAYGYIIIDVNSLYPVTIPNSFFGTPPRTVNETVKMDLGSRLLQPQTYQKAAVRMQKVLHRDVVQAQSMATYLEAAFLSRISSTVYLAAQVTNCTRAYSKMAGRTTVHLLKSSMNQTASTASMLSKRIRGAYANGHKQVSKDLDRSMNAMLGLATKVKSILPAKRSFKADLLRATRNARLLRERLLRGKKRVLPQLSRVETLRSKLIRAKKELVKQAQEWWNPPKGIETSGKSLKGVKTTGKKDVRKVDHKIR